MIKNKYMVIADKKRNEVAIYRKNGCIILLIKTFTIGEWNLIKKMNKKNIKWNNLMLKEVK